MHACKQCKFPCLFLGVNYFIFQCIGIYIATRIAPRVHNRRDKARVHLFELTALRCVTHVATLN